MKFLEANQPRQCSSAWRSILHTQALLKQGVNWIMGSGEQGRVWKDKWLPFDKHRPASGPGSLLFPNLKAKDLLAHGTLF